MSNRQIFPELKLFKKHVNEQFLVSLSEVFKRHPVYVYNEDDSLTKIFIVPSYNTRSFAQKMPLVISKVSGYNLSLQDTFGQNFYETLQNQHGVNSGSKSLQDMDAQITLRVQTFNEEESSDIADEILLLVTYATRGMFSQVGLEVMSGSVSETRLVDQSSEQYETQVMLNLKVPWEFKKVTSEEAIEGDIEFDRPEDFLDSYRRPNVYTIKGRFT